jgi:hypothetical protein
MTALGKKVDPQKVIKGKPPVILRLQPSGFVKIETPEEIRQWEKDVRNFFGISIDASGMVPCETFENGCSVPKRERSS